MGHRQPPEQGFTLLELLVVLVIMALATAGVTLALRDSQADALEHEALRLSAMLEAARAESRATGVAIHWLPRPDGFELRGAAARSDPQDALNAPQRWLNAGTQAHILTPVGAPSLLLGPEPLLPVQAVQLRSGEHVVTVGSNGLSAFAPQPATAGTP